MAGLPPISFSAPRFGGVTIWDRDGNIIEDSNTDEKKPGRDRYKDGEPEMTREEYERRRDEYERSRTPRPELQIVPVTETPKRKPQWQPGWEIPSVDDILDITNNRDKNKKPTIH